MDTLRIGQAAEQSGLSASAIRYYESLDIVPPPERTNSGYRGYSNDEVDLLRFVARLRALEFPLSDLREVVALYREGKAPCEKVRSTISREAAAIGARMRDLERLRDELRSLEDEAKNLADDWPSACICDLVGEPSEARV
jgi:MerR family copper efflux transcriptional regulator